MQTKFSEARVKLEADRTANYERIGARFWFPPPARVNATSKLGPGRSRREQLKLQSARCLRHRLANRLDFGNDIRADRNINQPWRMNGPLGGKRAGSNIPKPLLDRAWFAHMRSCRWTFSTQVRLKLCDDGPAAIGS